MFFDCAYQVAVSLDGWRGGLSIVRGLINCNVCSMRHLPCTNLPMATDGCGSQGFASGDAERDAYAIRKFVADGHNILLAQSYAKVCMWADR